MEKKIIHGKNYESYSLKCFTRLLFIYGITVLGNRGLSFFSSYSTFDGNAQTTQILSKL